jgi:hypothetical protein
MITQNNKIMAQQTVVSWVIEQLRQLAHNPKTHLGMGDVRVTQGYLDDLEEQANKQFQNKIIDAWEDGAQSEHRAHVNGKADKSSLDYYNETYKTEENGKE